MKAKRKVKIKATKKRRVYTAKRITLDSIIPKADIERAIFYDFACKPAQRWLKRGRRTYRQLLENKSKYDGSRKWFGWAQWHHLIPNAVQWEARKLYSYAIPSVSPDTQYHT